MNAAIHQQVILSPQASTLTSHPPSITQTINQPTLAQLNPPIVHHTIAQHNPSIMQGTILTTDNTQQQTAIGQLTVAPQLSGGLQIATSSPLVTSTSHLGNSSTPLGTNQLVSTHPISHHHQLVGPQSIVQHNHQPIKQITVTDTVRQQGKMITKINSSIPLSTLINHV